VTCQPWAWLAGKPYKKSFLVIARPFRFKGMILGLASLISLVIESGLSSS